MKRTITAIILSALTIFCASCSTEKIIYLEPPKIPQILLNDCIPKPIDKNNFTYGDSVVYNVYLLDVIKKCNIDKRAIRKINNDNKERKK